MADAPPEKSLDDFFAKRDKKKKKEKGKGKESAAGPTSAAVKKIKKEKEKSAKNENQDAQIEKVMLLLSGNFFFFFYLSDVFPDSSVCQVWHNRHNLHPIYIKPPRQLSNIFPSYKDSECKFGLKGGTQVGS